MLTESEIKLVTLKTVDTFAEECKQKMERILGGVIIFSDKDTVKFKRENQVLACVFKAKKIEIMNDYKTASMHFASLTKERAAYLQAYFNQYNALNYTKNIIKKATPEVLTASKNAVYGIQNTQLSTEHLMK